MYLTFEHPEFLWYLASIPVLIVSHFAFLKYSRRKAIRFANFQALKRVSEQHVVTRNHIILILRILIMASIIFSISGTVLWYKGLTNENDYIIALDTSSSMTAEDFYPNRLEAAKEYTKDFINELKSDSRIGLVTFSGAAFVENLPTKSRSEILESIRAVEIAHVGGTNIPDAIVTSTNLLLNSLKGKAIILITDGSNTAGYFTKDPVKEGIRYAKLNSVIIYTIGVGTNTGPIGYLPEYYNISAIYDEQNLLNIANATGGKYYNAANAAELGAAYADIENESKMAFISINMTVGLLIIALMLIFLEWGLISTRFRGLPG